jgi:prevent-host-death family protein
MEITAKELRSQTRLLLDAVDRGEEVTITFRGRPRARVVSIEENRETTVGETELFGLWADRDDLEEPAEYVRQLRRSRYP